MKGLNKLKLLELTGCVRLQSISRGIISSLIGLEELKMSGSFNKWEAEDRQERKNAALKELQALTNLTCLEIDIQDPTLVAENMHISKKLYRFCITFHKFDYLASQFYGYQKRMSLHLKEETCLGHWIRMQLLRETESLSLRGNNAKIVDLSKSRNIKYLELRECEMTKSVTTCDDVDVDAIVFPSSLEHVDLHSLPQLQEVSVSFQNLSSIRINDCPRLNNVAKLSMVGNECLPHLERLRIVGCEMMEQVMLWKEEDDNRIYPHVEFPKLKEVRLVSLPNLASFCQGIGGIEFPLLTDIYIEKCPKMESMVSCSSILESKQNKSGGASSNADAYASHLFCRSEKVSFGNLKVLKIDRNPFCGHEISVSSYQGLETLEISGYEGSRSLLSSSIAKNLVNLKSLRIQECDEIVQVIKDGDDEHETRMANNNLFPKLEELSLVGLPRLVSFSELKCDVLLPLLREATIKSCPKMKNWNLGFLVAPNLEAFTTDFDHHLELGVNVSFDRLKRLWIRDVGNVEYPFYHHKFFTSLVDGLEELELYGNGSTSLFPYSIAGKLVNLRLLEIYGCAKMVKVIEEDEDEEVVSGSRATLLLPKLEELQLTNLPKLISFCVRKCVVELPSLERVAIDTCPMMKSFSLGPLTAPNLKFIKIDDEEEEDEYVGGEDDLNGVVQQHYMAREKLAVVEMESGNLNSGNIMKNINTNNSPYLPFSSSPLLINCLFGGFNSCTHCSIDFRHQCNQEKKEEEEAETTKNKSNEGGEEEQKSKGENEDHQS